MYAKTLTLSLIHKIFKNGWLLFPILFFIFEEENPIFDIELSVDDAFQGVSKSNSNGSTRAHYERAKTGGEQCVKCIFPVWIVNGAQMELLIWIHIRYHSQSASKILSPSIYFELGIYKFSVWEFYRNGIRVIDSIFDGQKDIKLTWRGLFGSGAFSRCQRWRRRGRTWPERRRARPSSPRTKPRPPPYAPA